MKDENKGKKYLPPWVGNLPFSPEDKKPIIITRDMEVSTIYGNSPREIRIRKYISTDLITYGEFEIPPGGFFDPPDVHPGNECYTMIEGTAIVFNPKTGDTYQIQAGEAFLIEAGVWHQVFNFGHNNAKILGTIAPSIWSADELGSEIEYLAESKFFKHNHEVKTRWPPEKWSFKNRSMFPIRPEQYLQLIHGKTSHMLVTLYVSNQLLNVGSFTIASNGASDPEIHLGDEVIYVKEGPLTLQTYEDEGDERSVSHASFEVLPGEKMLIPKGVRHRYFNFSTQPITCNFSVAPKL